MSFQRVMRKYLWELFSTVLARGILYIWGSTVGKNLLVCGRLKILNDGGLNIGNDVQLNSGDANFVGGDRKMRIWIGINGHCHIGNKCGLSNTTIVCFNKVSIADNVYIGGGCEIYDTDFHQIDYDGRMTGQTVVPSGHVKIEEGVFIGSFCKILKNAQIGRGSVIGSGSVVTGQIPPREIWAGVPARLIRKL